MDVGTFRTIHRYGAVLSVVATALAGASYAILGPDNVVGLFLAWVGPLGVFYFGGAHLSETSTYRVLGEELMRGVVWYAGSIVAWAVIVSESTALAATPFTVFGLPALTALAIVLVMVAARYGTGSDLTVQSRGGQRLIWLTGAVAFGFLALYIVLTREFGWWFFGLYLATIPVGLGLRRLLRQRYPERLSPE